MPPLPVRSVSAKDIARRGPDESRILPSLVFSKSDMPYGRWGLSESYKVKRSYLPSFHNRFITRRWYIIWLVSSNKETLVHDPPSHLLWDFLGNGSKEICNTLLCLTGSERSRITLALITDWLVVVDSYLRLSGGGETPRSSVSIALFISLVDGRDWTEWVLEVKQGKFSPARSVRRQKSSSDSYRGSVRLNDKATTRWGLVGRHYYWIVAPSFCHDKRYIHRHMPSSFM